MPYYDPTWWCILPEFAARLAEADGCSAELALREIFDMLAEGTFPGLLGWDLDPGWDPPSPSEHWRRVKGYAKTGEVVDDFPRARATWPDGSVKFAETEDAPVSDTRAGPETRLLLFERAACEAYCEARRLAREKPPKTPRKERRKSKIARLLDETYGNGRVPAGVFRSQIIKDVKKKTRHTISRSGLHAYFNRPSDV
jgi:hypothetical protein